MPEEIAAAGAASAHASGGGRRRRGLALCLRAQEAERRTVKGTFNPDEARVTRRNRLRELTVMLEQQHILNSR